MSVYIFYFGLGVILETKVVKAQKVRDLDKERKKILKGDEYIRKGDKK